MLPRNSNTLRGKRAGIDTRKWILVVMLALFVSYFVVVNMFFSFSNPTPIANNEAMPQDNKALVENEAKEPVETPELPSPTPKWTRNPERKYVWLDIAIDDQYIGRVTAELYADLVPKTVENFRVLTTGEKGPDYSFKNSVCHRIIKGFVVQCGDFTTGKGYGGRSILDDEPNGLRLTHSKRYILQMANAGPNTNGSQFCFMLAAMPHLNGKHVVFGEVVDGFEVVDKMEAAGVDDDGIPLQHKVSLIDGGELL